MSRPRLTCCIIARDEEQMLPDCLASVAGIVDETIVVDTGSRDRTAELARRAGARVVSHEWRDDFAAARNAALEQVGEGWLLVLDADERLAPGAGRRIRSAIQEGGFDLGLLPLHHAARLDAAPESILDGSARFGDPVLLPRLLRRTPELAWRGRVHESVEDWAQGRPVRTLDAGIVHYGAVPELRETLGKNQRNLQLLERRAAEEPGDASVRAFLARELQRAGRREQALQEAEQAWEALLRAADRGEPREPVLPVTVYCQLLLELGRIPDLVEVLGEASRRGWEHPNFRFLVGVAAEQHALRADDERALLEEAARCYASCLEDADRSLEGEPIPGARGWQACTRLGTVELRRGSGEAALRCFDAALAERPESLEAQLGRAEALLIGDDPLQALTLLEPHTAEDQLDAWLLSTLAALALGRQDDASMLAAQVMRLAGSRPLLAPHRRPLLDDLCGEGAEPASGTERLPASRRPAAPRSAPESARSVLVLGAGRSGTSMVAGTLAEAGWWAGDDLIPARDSNPKGFFEAPEINGINESLLARAMPSWQRFGAGQWWLATPEGPLDPACSPQLEARISALLARRPFAYKDPRFCHTLPAWRPLLPEDVGLVCVFRDPATTAESTSRECAGQDYLRDVDMDFDRALAVWVSSYRAVLDAPRRDGEWLFVHYDQMLAGEGVDALEAFVGAPVAREVPEARLSRSGSERPVSEEAAAVYRELCALAGHASAGVSVQVPETLPRIGSCPEPALSVVLCTYDRLDTLRRSVVSFEAQREARDRFELVVVDDGSSDGTAAWLDGHDFQVPTTVVHRENGGLSAARNTGIAAARGELLLFVNDDTLAAPDLVARHLEAHAEADRARPGEPVCVLGSFEQPPDALAGALMRQLEQSHYVFCFEGMRPGERYDWTRFWTCNVSANADAVRRAGGFDESFRHYGCEDTDLGIRLEGLGYRVLYEPAARAVHEHVLDLDALEKRTLLVAKAWARIVAKHPETVRHPDWAWLAPLTKESCDRLVVERLPFTAQWRAAVEEIAAVDIARVESASPDAAARVLQALNAPLRELHWTWWHQGIAAGLDDFGVQSVAELGSAGALRPRTVLAWPCYGASGELDSMLAEYGAAMTEQPVRLVLIHDEGADGPVEDAVAQLERAYANHLPEGAPLDVELVGDPEDEGRVAWLRSTVDAVVELPGSQKGARRALIDRLAVPSFQAGPPA